MKDENIELAHDNEQAQQANITNEQLLPIEARKALVWLMRHGVVMADKKAKLFEVICLHQTLIRQYLAQVFINLILDEKAGVVYIANIENEVDDDSDGDEETATLIVRRTLTLFDTLILLILRKYYNDRETEGERKIIIDVEKVESNLTPFLPLTNSTKLERKKINATLLKMVNKKILLPIKGEDGRYELTPLIRYVVSAAFLESMLKQYEKLAKENNE